MFDRLHGTTRWTLGLIAIALGVGYFLPIWRIDLEAPQYPEGIGLTIWLDRIGGDINNINILNHYIGMRHIKPESFPELSLMPWLLAGFILAALAAVVWNRRAGLIAWFGALGLAGLVGLADFWRWTYDYGHNLDPTAAIKVPGMAYQPPVFGTKMLLNFTAHSFPAAGGWLLIGAGVLAAGLVAYELLSKTPPKPERKPGPRVRKVLAHSLILPLLLSLAMSACSPHPEPLIFTSDVCHHCKMTLMDPKYGAELVTKKGKVFKFDSVECLGAYLHEQSEAGKTTHSLWVVDANKPGELIQASGASYLKSPQLASPMGAGLTALADPAAAESLRRRYSGQILSWEQTLAVLKPAGTISHASQDHAAHDHADHAPSAHP